MQQNNRPQASRSREHTTDYVVIGSGIGGEDRVCLKPLPCCGKIEHSMLLQVCAVRPCLHAMVTASPFVRVTTRLEGPHMVRPQATRSNFSALRPWQLDQMAMLDKVAELGVDWLQALNSKGTTLIQGHPSLLDCQVHCMPALLYTCTPTQQPRHMHWLVFAAPEASVRTAGEGVGSNPLKQVLDAVGEKVECAVYDRVSLQMQAAPPAIAKEPQAAVTQPISQQLQPFAVHCAVAPVALGALLCHGSLKRKAICWYCLICKSDRVTCCVACTHFQLVPMLRSCMQCSGSPIPPRAPSPWCQMGRSMRP